MALPESDLQTKLSDTVLKLEIIDKNLYRGVNLWKPIGGRAVFGGQVVGQALVAAGKTKTDDVHIHSMHCYFIRPGNPDYPILYQVDRTRDGNSFTSRTVKATQNGETILSLMVSYHKHEDGAFENQYQMPQVPAPEGLITYRDHLKSLLSSDSVSEKQKYYISKYLATDIPVEVRPVEVSKYSRTVDSHRQEGDKPAYKLWIKAKGHIGDDHNLHRCVAAYFSDIALLGSALLPFPRFRPTMMASLDHSMWFHNHFKADEWMLYECESPRSVGARSLTLGRLWRRDGTLAVSVAQEGVIRGVNKSARTSKL